MNKNKLRPLIFGEVLFDHFPDGSKVLGGAPFNVAWHLQAFGHAPLFVSSVGDDIEGEQIKAAMHTWGMDVDGLQTNTQHATGNVDVSFSDGEPQYDIVFPRAFDFIDSKLLPQLSDNFLVYHGSLALRDTTSTAALAEVFRRTQAPVFVDVNLRQPWWDMGRIKQMLSHAYWIKLNSDEFKLIAPESNAYSNQTFTNQHGGFIALTRGSKGASLISEEKTETIVPQHATNFVDTVGAGDAFCSVLLTGIIRDWPLDMTITRAQDFASAVVGIRGATSTDPKFYQRFLDAWRD
ncbi:MAG: hypothetical protein AUK35_02685 [Zetaproteobacteria bacterium CG2_30_46_52]|nr:MAG: hypothetical protein AUK35_02685 [Zetaproteobacteria bacterium CG2_30_46_52]